jgi:hypothetical protein
MRVIPYVAKLKILSAVVKDINLLKPSGNFTYDQV